MLVITIWFHSHGRPFYFREFAEGSLDGLGDWRVENFVERDLGDGNSCAYLTLIPMKENARVYGIDPWLHSALKDPLINSGGAICGVEVTGTIRNMRGSIIPAS
jgi:hypothetical protein